MFRALAAYTLDKVKAVVINETQVLEMAQLIRIMTGITAAAALAAIASAIGLAGHVQAAQKAYDAPLRIVVLSDSSLAGAFPGWIQKKLRDSYSSADEVRNPDIANDNAADVLAHLDRLVPQGTEAVIVALGANDGFRNVDPTTTGKALAAILDRLDKRDIAVLLCAARAPHDRPDAYTKRFNAMFLKLAEERNILSCPRKGNTALKSLAQAIEDDDDAVLDSDDATLSGELDALSFHVRERRQFAEFESSMASTSSAVPARNKAPFRITVLSNSLVAGLNPGAAESFPASLQKALATLGMAAEITHADISDRTAAQVLVRFDQFVPEGTDGVVLALGANDAQRHIDPKTTYKALVAINDRLVERNLPTILCGNEHYYKMYQRLSADYSELSCPRLLGKARGVDHIVFDIHKAVSNLSDFIGAQRRLSRESDLPEPETAPHGR